MSALSAAGQDGRRPIPPPGRNVSGGWLLSCALHAACLMWLSLRVEPPRTGVHGGVHNSVIEARFGTARPKPSRPLDTALPDEIIQTVAVSVARDPSITTESEETPESTADAEPPPSVPAPRRPGRRPARPSAWKPSRAEPPYDEGLARTTAPSRRFSPTSVSPRAGTAPGSHVNPRDRGAAGSPHGNPGTTFFDVHGDGKKFVYVIDCSGSMSDRSILASAREELFASLDGLSPAALVQVIFYNDRPHAALAGGQEPRLVRNTSSERRRIRQFSLGIVAGGGTHHLSALELALQLDPDVIFWLTDADEPLLTTPELRQLERRNRRHVPIHAIEFGHGPPLSADNFLMRVARASGGSYGYCDLDSPSAKRIGESQRR